MINHGVLCSSQDHLRTETHDLDYMYLKGAKNTDSWRARKGDLQRAFPLDVPMVPSSTLRTVNVCRGLFSPSVNPFALGASSSSPITSLT
jgi:hypothetical protein